MLEEEPDAERTERRQLTVGQFGDVETVDNNLAGARAGFYAGDADLDVDGDGLSNREEYLRGSDPRSAEALLQILAPRREGDLFMFEFTASANQSYSVQYSTDLDSGSWIKLKDIAPEPALRNVAVAVPLTGNGPAGFYRVLTP